MDVSLATNPDGSETLLLRQGDKSEGALAPVSVPTGMPLPTTPAPTLAKNDPFFEQDTIAKNEFERMKGQDLAALAGHTPADAEFTRVVVQDSAVIPGHTTYATYVASSHRDDHGVQRAIQATDIRVQQAVSNTSAGPNPVLPDTSLQPTPGIDWLARMREMDAALCKAVQGTDMPHRSVP